MMATAVEGKSLPERWSYDWGKFMDGRYWELRRGTDFPSDATVKSVRQAAYGYASRAGFRVSTSEVDGDTVGVQAHRE